MNPAVWVDDLVPDVCAFLASDKAANISGVVFGVEGRNVFEYKMVESPKLAPKDRARWSIDELAERWDEIRVKYRE